MWEFKSWYVNVLWNQPKIKKILILHYSIDLREERVSQKTHMKILFPFLSSLQTKPNLSFPFLLFPPPPFYKTEPKAPCVIKRFLRNTNFVILFYFTNIFLNQLFLGLHQRVKDCGWGRQWVQLILCWRKNFWFYLVGMKFLLLFFLLCFEWVKILSFVFAELVWNFLYEYALFLNQLSLGLHCLVHDCGWKCWGGDQYWEVGKTLGFVECVWYFSSIFFFFLYFEWVRTFFWLLLDVYEITDEFLIYI